MFTKISIILLSFFFLSCRCSSPSSFLQIDPNTPQRYTFSADSEYIFQVTKSQSRELGTFTILIEKDNWETESSFKVIRDSCENFGTNKRLQSGDASKLTKIFFVGNSSENNCFQIQFDRTSNLNLKGEFIVKVSFIPSENPLKINETLLVDFEAAAERQFTLYNNDKSSELFLISIEENNSSQQSSSTSIRFKPVENICINITSSLFLCQKYQYQDTLKFSFYNQAGNCQVRITVSELKFQEQKESVDVQLNSTIPGFGTFVQVRLPEAGVLQVNAFSSSDNQPLPLLMSTSLMNLIIMLSQHTMTENKPESLKPLLTSTHKRDTIWYCFIPHEGQGTFRFNSQFTRHTILQVDTDALIFIDPEVSPYQFLELKLGSRDFPEKFEFHVKPLQQESAVEIYLNANNFDPSNPQFKTQKNHYQKEITRLSLQQSEVSLSFLVGSNENSVYITIHAQTRGYYKIKGTRTEFGSVWVLTKIFASLILLVTSILFCLTKIFTNRKPHSIPYHHRWLGFDVSLSIDVSEGHDLENPAQSGDHGLHFGELNQIKVEDSSEKKPEIRIEEHGQYCFDSNDVNEENQCDICYEKKKIAVFEPCNHSCACGFCSLMIIETSSKCPLCRAKIERVYFKKSYEQEEEVSNQVEICVE